MSSRPHPRLAELFAGATSVPSTERAEFLDRECAGDEALRREVENLIIHDAANLADAGKGSFVLDGAPFASAGAIVEALVRDSDESERESLEDAAYARGTIVDRYTIVEPVGAGGFGVVYLARQSPPEERSVALKILERLPLSRRGSRRFEEERRALARMDHPGVAKIYSGGITERGHPYFAMEFISGSAADTPGSQITEYADQQRLSIRERIELFIQVCLAVEHAHQQGIIHRDLKPSNILVARVSGRANPKIIDFGIARAVSDEEAPGLGRTRTLLTLREEILGTPAYMSPEQAARSKVDTRTDVYSLGVVLYELLCGTLPLPLDAGSGPIDMHLRAIREADPARPSKALPKTESSSARIAEARATDPRKLAKLLRGDLEAILLKLLEKDPARRYQSAGAVADELRRYLMNQPIQARAPTLFYTLAKVTRRHRGAVAGAAVVCASLIAATASSLNSARKANMRAAVANVLAAQSALLSDDGAKLARQLDRVPPDLRTWEWGCLKARADRSAHQFDLRGGSVSAMAISADGKRLLSGDRDGIVKAWEIASGEQLELPVKHTRGPSLQPDVWSISWSPAGDRFATGSFDGTARVWSADGASQYKFERQGGIAYESVYAVAFSPDGRWLAIGGGHSLGTTKSFVALRDAESGAEVSMDHSWHAAPVMDLAFTADGRWLASASDDKTVGLWHFENGVLTRAVKLPEGQRQVNAVAFNPDGSLLAVGTADNRIVLYKFPSLETAKALGGHRAPLASLAFSPDGALLASASWDSTVRIWSVPDWREQAVLRGHQGRVNRVAFAPDGRLFSASDDRSVREWDPPFQADVRVLRVPDVVKNAVRKICFLADGRLAAAYDGPGLRLWKPQVRQADAPPLQDLRLTGVSPDGSTLAWIGKDALMTWRSDTGISEHRHSAIKGSLPMTCLPMNDRHVVVACESGLMCLNFINDTWQRIGSVPTNLEAEPLSDKPTLYYACLGRDGQALAALWVHGSALSMQCQSGLKRLEDKENQLNQVAATTSALIAIVVRDSRSLVVCDMRTGEQLARLVGHREKVIAAAFSPDESRLASVANDHTLRIWDWRRGEEVLWLPHPAWNEREPSTSSAEFTTIAWSLDGKTIATGSLDGTIHLWVSEWPEGR